MPGEDENEGLKRAMTEVLMSLQPVYYTCRGHTYNFIHISIYNNIAIVINSYLCFPYRF